MLGYLGGLLHALHHDLTSDLHHARVRLVNPPRYSCSTQKVRIQRMPTQLGQRRRDIGWQQYTQHETQRVTRRIGPGSSGGKNCRGKSSRAMLAIQS